MFIDYGVNNSSELVYIDQVPRGATQLHCPYCGGLLTAKKGQQIAHHFAHTGETCRQVERAQDVIALPAYNNFNMHLSGRDLTKLRALRDKDYGEYSGLDLERLERQGVAQQNDWTGNWELTKLGKIPFGDLSLMLFNQIQEQLIAEKHDQLEASARVAYEKPNVEAKIAEIKHQLDALRKGSGGTKSAWELYAEWNALLTQFPPSNNNIDYQTAITDLHLYRAQWRRLLSCTLYFLSINDGQLHKIGVTIRDPAERIAEVKADLAPHLGTVQIKALGVWQHRGNVELYFKHRYKAYQQPVGTLTEYFKFDDWKPILTDLRRMKPKELTPLELSVLAGYHSELERQIENRAIERRRLAGISEGMKRAAARGRPIGRPVGVETVETFLAKPDSVAVRAALEQGLSLRQAAERSGVSLNTVRKVKAALRDSDSVRKITPSSSPDEAAESV